MTHWKRFSIYGGILLLLILLPLITTRTDLLTWFTFTLLYITLSQSWNIIGGYAGQQNLGHAAFFGLGALGTRYIWLSGIPLPIAFLAGALTASIFAILIGFPAFRLKGIYFVIGTLVLADVAWVSYYSRIYALVLACMCAALLPMMRRGGLKDASPNH